MKAIENRSDINKLVLAFYATIRKDELLGPIFNKQIAPDHWPAHLEKLTDFWETNLFAKPVFKGNPTQAHIKTDFAFNNTISKEHFDHWLELWFQTIDSMYEGELAERAKHGAQNMATMQFIKIFQSRPKED